MSSSRYLAERKNTCGSDFSTDPILSADSINISTRLTTQPYFLWVFAGRSYSMLPPHCFGNGASASVALAPLHIPTRSHLNGNFSMSTADMTLFLVGCWQWSWCMCGQYKAKKLRINLLIARFIESRLCTEVWRKTCWKTCWYSTVNLSAICILEIKVILRSELDAMDVSSSCFYK